MRFRSRWIQPQSAGIGDVPERGWANDRGTKSSACWIFSASCIPATSKPRWSAAPTTSNSSPTPPMLTSCRIWATAAAGPKCARCGMRSAPAVPSLRCECRQPGRPGRGRGGRVHPRVLPQEHQSAHALQFGVRRLLHGCATAGNQPDPGSHRHHSIWSAAPDSNAASSRDPDRPAAGARSPIWRRVAASFRDAAWSGVGRTAAHVMGAREASALIFRAPLNLKRAWRDFTPQRLVFGHAACGGDRGYPGFCCSVSSRFGMPKLQSSAGRPPPRRL